MQTFVPYANCRKSALVLDYKRLGKQRVECKQILNALDALRTGDLHILDKRGRKRKRGWLNHPCTQMWIGHEGFLINYAIFMVGEWRARGYKDTMLSEFLERANRAPEDSFEPPEWWGREDIHYSHQCRLVAKDPTHYAPLFPTADPKRDYVWAI